MVWYCANWSTLLWLTLLMRELWTQSPIWMCTKNLVRNDNANFELLIFKCPWLELMHRKSKLGVKCSKGDWLSNSKYWFPRSYRGWNFIIVFSPFFVVVVDIVITSQCLRATRFGSRASMADNQNSTDGSYIAEECSRAGAALARGWVHGVVHEAESGGYSHAVAELPPEKGRLEESCQELYHWPRGLT